MQYDVKIKFFHRILDEIIFVKQSKKAEMSDIMVFQLLKTLYGLKHLSWCLNTMFNNSRLKKEPLKNPLEPTNKTKFRKSIYGKKICFVFLIFYSFGLLETKHFLFSVLGYEKQNIHYFQLWFTRNKTFITFRFGLLETKHSFFSVLVY